MRRTQHKAYIPVNTNKQRYKVTIRPDTSRMGIDYFKKVGGMEWVCKKLSMIYINVTAAQDYLEEVQDAIAKYNLKLDNLGKYAADSVKSNMRFIDAFYELVKLSEPMMPNVHKDFTEDLTFWEDLQHNKFSVPVKFTEKIPDNGTIDK